MNEQRCETCRWWQRLDFPTFEGDRVERPHGSPEPEPERWGQCQFVNDGGRYDAKGQDPTAPRAFTSDASGYSSWLTTRDDFGCVEWATGESE